MAESNNRFAGGKMNKDFDERLVPSNEYRDALNVQTSTSDGSDVGTLQKPTVFTALAVLKTIRAILYTG
jgi:hypothetical protein